MCYVCVWAADGKDGGSKEEVRNSLERMMGLMELEVIYCEILQCTCWNSGTR